MEIRRTTWVETFARPEFQQIIKDYADESGSPFMRGAPNPDEYIAAEKAGAFIPVGVFDGGRIVGGVNIMIHRIPHYQEVLASVESIFLAKEFRHGTAGLRLLREAEKVARDAGAQVLMVGTRCGSRFEELCRRLYTPVNTVFQVRL